MTEDRHFYTRGVPPMVIDPPLIAYDTKKLFEYCESKTKEQGNLFHIAFYLGDKTKLDFRRTYAFLAVSVDSMPWIYLQDESSRIKAMQQLDEIIHRTNSISNPKFAIAKGG